MLDKNYRNAAKRDRSDFSSDLCPYELGLIDTVAQVLLPSIKEGISAEGVRAELYALNIYSAPSGFFKSHVGTPRSESQFGSLVVSLPCRHEGGQLTVRHASPAFCTTGAPPRPGRTLFTGLLFTAIASTRSGNLAKAIAPP